MGKNIHNNSEQPLIICNEMWKPITDDNVKNVLPIYFVSDYGRIYSMVHQTMLNRILDNKGYYRVNLFLKNNSNSVQKSIARIVKQAFDPISNPEEYDVHHIDRITFNNHISNLQWVTPEEHQLITKATWPKGRDSKLYGPNGSNAILTGEQVIEIKNRVISGNYITFSKLAEEFGVSENCILSIVYEQSWAGFGPKVDPALIRVSTGFTNQEIEKICLYFETHDINNRRIYPTMSKLLRSCYFDLELDKIYGSDYEFKRKLLTKILLKNSKYINSITKKYLYNYNLKDQTKRGDEN